MHGLSVLEQSKRRWTNLYWCSMQPNSWNIVTIWELHKVWLWILSKHRWHRVHFRLLWSSYRDPLNQWQMQQMPWFHPSRWNFKKLRSWQVRLRRGEERPQWNLWGLPSIFLPIWFEDSMRLIWVWPIKKHIHKVRVRELWWLQIPWLRRKNLFNWFMWWGRLNLEQIWQVWYLWEVHSSRR